MPFSFLAFFFLAIQPWRYKPRIYNWAYWASGGFLHFVLVEEWNGVVISAGAALQEVKSHDVVKVTIYPKDMFKTGCFPQTALQIPFAPTAWMNLQWCFPSAVSTICVALIGCVWKGELKKGWYFFKVQQWETCFIELSWIWLFGLCSHVPKALFEDSQSCLHPHLQTHETQRANLTMPAVLHDIEPQQWREFFPRSAEESFDILEQTVCARRSRRVT